MANLQELYDYYLETNPSTGKIRNATNFLIHACQAMEVSCPEAITDEMIEELPLAIDRYFRDNYQKAVHDKGVLAEMIGRYGPKNGWENVYRVLLRDKDENLRQFTLQAIEFSARKNPEIAMPYIETFRQGKNKLMRRVAALLSLRIICNGQKEFIRQYIDKWAKEDVAFTALITDLLEHQAHNSMANLHYKLSCQEAFKWLRTYLQRQQQ